jgi:hypothetical protein
MALKVSGGHPQVSLSGITLHRHGLPAQWRWLLPVALAASVAAWLAGVTSGDAEGAVRIALMTAGAVFTAVAAGLPLWQEARAARAEADALDAATAARAQMRVAIEDALDPFTSLLVQLAAARGIERGRLKGEAVQLALTSVAQLAPRTDPEGLAQPRRLRVCLFVVEPGPPRRLLPQSYAGRAGVPTVAFDDTTRAGQALLRVLETGWVVVDDVERERATPWWDDLRAYRTYAAGPVVGPDGTPFALLTVDALAPGELEGLDLPLIRLIAHLLSLATHM